MSRWWAERAENFGELIADTVGKRYKDFLIRRAEAFKNLQIYGLEHLLSLKDQPFFLVANHLSVTDRFPRKLVGPPDAFLIGSLIRNSLGVEPTGIVRNDKPITNKAMELYQKYFYSPVSRGINRNSGLIPVHRLGGSNREVFQDVQEAIDQKKPIITYPEGGQFEDFQFQRPLDLGAAHMSIKFQVPLLPAYIRGVRSWWDTGQEKQIAFHQPLIPPANFSGDAKRNLTEQIRQSIAELQQFIEDKKA